MSITMRIVDNCLPTFWAGSDLPYVSVELLGTIMPDELVDAVDRELQAGAVDGRWFDGRPFWEALEDGDEVYDALRRAVEEFAEDCAGNLGWGSNVNPATLDYPEDVEFPRLYIVFDQE